MGDFLRTKQKERRLGKIWQLYKPILHTKRKERRLGEIWQLYKPKLRVDRLHVIRIRKVCESMRFDSGPEVSVRVNPNYVLTEYVLNENDCSLALHGCARNHCAASAVSSVGLGLEVMASKPSRVALKCIDTGNIMFSHWVYTSTNTDRSQLHLSWKPSIGSRSMGKHFENRENPRGSQAYARLAIE